MRRSQPATRRSGDRTWRICPISREEKSGGMPSETSLDKGILRQEAGYAAPSGSGPASIPGSVQVSVIAEKWREGRGDFLIARLRIQLRQNPRGNKHLL